jgi:AcrR family transcriptional regulator
MSVLARKRTYLPAETRRAQILDVAKGVFARRGYHAANVAHICAAAKIGRGTLYQYFGNKRAVLLAILGDVQARVRAVVDGRPRVGEIPGAAAAGASPELVQAFCARRLREVLDAVFVDEATLRLILKDARGLDATVSRAIAEIDDRMLAALEADVRAAQRLGILRAGNPKLVARYLLGGVEKMVLAALTSDERIDLDAIVELAVSIQLFGILKIKERRS